MGDLEYKKDKQLKEDQQLITVVPDITVTEIQQEDRFLLMGCDGIWVIFVWSGNFEQLGIN